MTLNFFLYTQQDVMAHLLKQGLPMSMFDLLKWNGIPLA
jgi:hypothetical protein